MPEPFRCNIHGWSTDPLCREYCCNTALGARLPLCRGCGVRFQSGHNGRVILGGPLEGVYHDDCMPAEVQT